MQDYNALLPHGTVRTTNVGLVVCGASSVGKKTLVRTLDSAGVLGCRAKLPNPQHNTTSFNVRIVSGTPAHLAALPLVARGRRAVFVVAASLADPRQQVLNQLQRWLRLIRALVLSDTKPVVHVVLTHRDALHAEHQDPSFVGAWNSNWGVQVIKKLKREFSDCLDVDECVYVIGEGAHGAGPVLDTELQSFCQALRRSKARMLSSAGKSLWVVEEAAAQVDGLRQQHSKWPIVSEAEFWGRIQLSKNGRRLNLETMKPAILRQLEANDEVVWLPEAGLVVLSPDFLVEGVLEQLSPRHIYVDLEPAELRGTGRVTLATLKQKFDRRKLPHVLAIIKALDFGFECTSDKTVMLPALVTQTRVAEWSPSKQSPVLGRRLRLLAPTDCFDELFFYKLQARLSGFLSGQQPHLWRDGVCGAKDGVQCFVLISLGGQGIDVWATGSDARQVHRVVDEVVDIFHLLRVEQRVNLQPMVYALSQNLLRKCALDCRDDVLGCLVEDLEKMNPADEHGQPTLVAPEHPLHIPQPGEPVVGMLGHLPGQHAMLWPLAVLDVINEKLQVLIVRVNLFGTRYPPLDSDGEERAIREVIKHSPYRSCIELVSIPAANSDDIRAAVSKYRPHIIHIGHSGPDGLACYSNNRVPTNIDATRGTVKVSGEDLSALLRDFYHTQPLALVVVHGCDAEEIAQRLLSVALCVVCPTKTLADKIGAPFSSTFYQALFGGEKIQDAFDSANEEIKSQVAGSVRGFKDPHYVCMMRNTTA